jgi:hypothetical protein
MALVGWDLDDYYYSVLYYCNSNTLDSGKKVDSLAFVIVDR